MDTCDLVRIVAYVLIGTGVSTTMDEEFNADIVRLDGQDELGPISLADVMNIASMVAQEQSNVPTNRESDPGCDTYRTVLEVAYPGCVPRRVMTTACRGTCRSWTFPEWVHETGSIHMIENCQCCKPLVRRAISVRLDCPQRAGHTKKIMVWAGLECRCRPCSDGNPDSEQPYDY